MRPANTHNTDVSSVQTTGVASNIIITSELDERDVEYPNLFESDGQISGSPESKTENDNEKLDSLKRKELEELGSFSQEDLADPYKREAALYRHEDGKNVDTNAKKKSSFFGRIADYFRRKFNFSSVSKRFNKKASKILQYTLDLNGTFQVYKTPGDGNCVLWAWEQCRRFGENSNWVPTAEEYEKFCNETIPSLRGKIADDIEDSDFAAAKRIKNPGLFNRRLDPNYVADTLAKEAGRPVVFVYQMGDDFVKKISDPNALNNFIVSFDDVKDKNPIIIYCVNGHARAVTYRPNNVSPQQ